MASPKVSPVGGRWRLLCGLLICGSPAQAQTSAHGRIVEIRLSTPSHVIHREAPHAVVHIPTQFDPRRQATVLVFLHGWNGCARVLANRDQTRCHPTDREREGWALAAAHESAGTNSVLVVPQLAWRARDGDAGRFAEDGFAAQYLNDVLAKVGIRLQSPRIVVAAHSAGFESALAWIEHGDVEVESLVLFDALYAGTDRFFGWLQRQASRRLISIYTGSGSTSRQNRRLRRMARVHQEEVDRELGSGRLQVVRTRVRHAEIPRRLLTEVAQLVGTH